MMKLDVGCGRKKRGDIGIDYYKDTSADIIADAHYLPFPGELFDEVTSTTVIEHSPNPLEFLKEQRRVLKKGGKIEVVTDNAQYYRWTVMKFHGLRHQNLQRDHYTIFFPEGIVRLLKLAGFRNIRFEFWRDPRKLDILTVFLIKIGFWREESLFSHFKVVGFKIG